MTGWGTICGSEAGAAVVTNVIIGPRIAGSKDGAMMGSEIMQWYSETPLPVYVPKEPKITTEIIKTTSDSPLCHVSVGRWMKAANKPFGSAERKDRCARLTASVAYHTVKLLNDWKDGKYHTKGTIPPEAMEYQPRIIAQAATAQTFRHRRNQSSSSRFPKDGGFPRLF